ncbi:hypothetical protein CFter6_4728 [Collimonas fungivorans]|uniref:Uncharacterized protein n=1 Tax=Collimonas fungivorans TaxID=158899 RepID=A0A127PIQ4_9BURK|nr:hypothetical protein CFter6_4728 [Collimonas fungivorans]
MNIGSASFHSDLQPDVQRPRSSNSSRPTHDLPPTMRRLVFL